MYILQAKERQLRSEIAQKKEDLGLQDDHDLRTEEQALCRDMDAIKAQLSSRREHSEEEHRDNRERIGGMCWRISGRSS